MAKFKKKPITIEAVQWKNGKVSEVTEWISEALYKNPKEVGAIMRFADEIRIFTLEGYMTATDGDYIIIGVEGEIYPCKPEIFKKTYDAVL